jgi:hypothetical protein
VPVKRFNKLVIGYLLTRPSTDFPQKSAPKSQPKVKHEFSQENPPKIQKKTRRELVELEFERNDCFIPYLNVVRLFAKLHRQRFQSLSHCGPLSVANYG